MIIVAYQLVGEATHWWKSIENDPSVDTRTMTWAQFVELFNSKYFSDALRSQMRVVLNSIV